MTSPSRRTLRIVLFGLGLLGLVWQHVQATRLGYEVERSRKRAQALRGKLAADRLDLETGLSPSRLADAARTKLGMFPAGPEVMRQLPGSSGAPARPGLFGELLPKSWRGAPSPLDT